MTKVFILQKLSFQLIMLFFPNEVKVFMITCILIYELKSTYVGFLNQNYNEFWNRYRKIILVHHQNKLVRWLCLSFLNKRPQKSFHSIPFHYTVCIYKYDWNRNKKGRENLQWKDELQLGAYINLMFWQAQFKM